MTEGSDQSNGIKSKNHGTIIRIGNDFYNIDESIRALNFDTEILAIYKNHPHRPKSYKFEVSDIPIFHFMHEFYRSKFKSDRFLKEIEHGNLWGDELKPEKPYTTFNIDDLFDKECLDNIEHEIKSFIESEENSWSYILAEPEADIVSAILEYLGEKTI